MLVWCTMIVTTVNCLLCNAESVETAVQGKIISENDHSYLVDFSEYAKKHEYEGDYSHRIVEKFNCVKEKEVK